MINAMGRKRSAAPNVRTPFKSIIHEVLKVLIAIDAQLLSAVGEDKFIDTTLPFQWSCDCDGITNALLLSRTCGSRERVEPSTDRSHSTSPSGTVTSAGK